MHTTLSISELDAVSGGSNLINPSLGEASMEFLIAMAGSLANGDHQQQLAVMQSSLDTLKHSHSLLRMVHN